MKPPAFDLVRNMLAVLFIVAIIAVSAWLLAPFLPALVWATLLVVATWPLMLAVQRRLWGKRSLAVITMTLALLLVVLAPLGLAVSTIVVNADDLGARFKYDHTVERAGAARVGRTSTHRRHAAGGQMARARRP